MGSQYPNCRLIAIYGILNIRNTAVWVKIKNTDVTKTITKVCKMNFNGMKLVNLVAIYNIINKLSIIHKILFTLALGVAGIIRNDLRNEIHSTSTIFG